MSTEDPPTFAIQHDEGWDIDSVKLTTIGIDIGTSSTIVSVASLSMKRMARDLSSQFTVVSRRENHGSRIMFTPYTGDERIDGDALKKMIDEFYSEHGVRPDDVDTGVVILTGEALLKKNSEAVANIVSLGRGRFVTIAAGHLMEATLAAFGSGAVELSKKEGKRILNIDIGGGTTKLSVIENGEIESVQAVRVGGHTIVRGPDGRITRIEESGKAVLEWLGYESNPGDLLDDGAMEKVSEFLAHSLFDAIFDAKSNDIIPDFTLTPLSAPPGKDVDAFVVSGGVGEHFYDPDTEDFGDLGKGIATVLRKRLSESDISIMRPDHCIRATVMGLSQYTAQISGSTVYVSDENALPLFNIRTVKIEADLIGDIDSEKLRQRIKERTEMFEVDVSSPFAMFFHWDGAPSYRRLRAFCEGIIRFVGSIDEGAPPLILIFDEDVAWIIGDMLKSEMGVRRKVVCVDGVSLGDLEFIDIGSKIYPAGVLPLTVKSLLFH